MVSQGSYNMRPVNLYDKTCKEHKEKDIVENAWKKVAEELDFIDDVTHSGFFCFGIAFAFLSLFFGFLHSP